MYRLFLQMSKITNNDFNHLPNMDISVLITTLERAARLLPEANEETETHSLRSKLVNLSIRVHAYLDSESSLRYDPYSYTVDEGEEEQYNNTSFDPYSYILVEGEEEQYNNTYKVYEGENVSFTKYNIDKSVPGRAYFKSCGIFIRVEDDKPRSAKADFTPFNVQLPRVVYYRQAIAMAYRGMKNFLHAFDQHQIGTEQLKEIYGYTNPTMAKFVLRFGFKIKLDEIDKKDLDIEDDSDNITIYSREDIKSNNIKLDRLTEISVVGSIEDIRSELARFEEKGSVERLVTGKKNPTSKRDIRYTLKKLKKFKSKD